MILGGRNEDMRTFTIHSFTILRRWVNPWMVLLLTGFQAAGVEEQPPFSFLEETCPPAFGLTVPLQWQETGEVRIAFNVQEGGDFYYALCSPETVGFFKEKDGQATALGRFSVPATGPVAEPVELTLQRHPWRMALVLGDQVVARAWDGEFAEGRMGLWASNPDWLAEEPRLQPLEDLYLTDDFMRTGDATGGWEAQSGEWAVSGPTLPLATAERSANPFTYRAQAEPHRTALALTGYWFWSDYRVEVSVKPEGDGVIGLCLYAQDAENYLLFRWASPSGAGRQQLVQVRRGEETVLAESPGGFVPGQWYRLGAEVVDGLFLARVDRREVLRARTDAFGQGQAGLYARAGDAALTVHFDDALIESVQDFRDDTITEAAGQWVPVQGSWQVAADGSGHRADGGGPALCVTGHSEWRDYLYQALVDPPTAGSVGLCFAYRDAQNFGLLRVSPPAAELIRVAGDERTVLDCVPFTAPPEKPWELSVRLDRGFIQARVGKGSLAAFAPDLAAGQVGLVAEGYSGWVRGITVEFPPSSTLTAPVKAAFIADQNMRNWATSAGEWQTRAGGDIWHKARLLGMTTVEFPLPKLNEDASLSVVLGADEDGTGGYGLTFTSEGEGAAWQLTRGDEVVAHSQPRSAETLAAPFPHSPIPLFPHSPVSPFPHSPVPPLPASVRFQRRGPLLAVWADDQLLTVYRDPEPLLGTRVVLRPRGLNPDLAQFHAASENGFDDTFHRAPVDWWVARGTWSLAQRWTCQNGGQWTFFGGFNDLACVLWSKGDFAGDQTLEFYVGPAAVNGSRQWRDLNAALCGDGANLDSGYTLLIGGGDGRTNRLYRKGKILAEGRGQPLAAEGADWPAVRWEKHGGQLRAFFKEALILEATDPEPLDGGKVAVWTYNNNLLLARARVWAERIGEWRPIPFLSAEPPAEETGSGPAAWPGQPPCNNDFEQGLGTWSAPHAEDRALLRLDETTARQGRRSLKIVNARAGGYFTVRAAQEPLDVAQFPVLRFDYRVPPEVKVNLYLRVEDRQGSADWWEITFTGPGEPARRQHWLGAIPDVVADNEWRHAEFDVGKALETALKGRRFVVKGLAFAAPKRDYLPCGLGGNPLGATYYLDDFRLMAREQGDKVTRRASWKTPKQEAF